MSSSFPKKSRHQLTGPTLSQDSSKDWALWRLSLILREIAESLASNAEKGTLPRRAPAGMAQAKAQGHSLGRKPLNIPVINVCDALQAYSSIAAAARELKCSRGYIHKELERYGVTPADVINGRWQPPR